MNAWELLTEHSSLSSGTAWEHLNNQVGGSGEVVVGTLVQSEGILVSVRQSVVKAIVEADMVCVKVEPVRVVIDTDGLNLGIEDA
jgi:hypothetical protein